MQARIADLHRHAQREALARAARQARRAQRHPSRHPIPTYRPIAMRKMLAALGTRSP